MGHFICIHGHFYQPPRENPWIEEVEVEDSAYPYHDWNARITAECYAPNTASRILDGKKSIVDIVNNFSSISFNFGPTLLMWLEQNNPDVYSAILDADRESIKRFSGHGSAIAQVYNHIIMPLANTRDKRTQVIWGIRDFVHRFGRSPEGMWLAETAVDLETLEVLAEQGILFTILSPAQAARIKPVAGPVWTAVSAETLDCSMPYLCQLGSGRSIAIFFFENGISQELAFGSLLEDGGRFADRMMGYFSRPGKDAGLLSVVSDGETYGHHHRFADMALAYALYDIQETRQATITIFGEYLARHPPTYLVEIKEDTSWSCPHGIERWRSDCGCCTRGTTVSDTDAYPRKTPAASGSAPARPGTCNFPGHQKWRAPFREAMDRLRDDLAVTFETAMSRYVADPWKARDDYISVILDRSEESRERFLASHASRALSDEEKRDTLRLLEMERHALLMFTSCGWFFDDIAGIESIQVMEYACRAMQLAREVSGTNHEPSYLSALSRAASNDPGLHDAAAIYLNYVQKSVIDLNRIVFNYALSHLITDAPGPGIIRHYLRKDESLEKVQTGELRMITGALTLQSDITCEQKRLEYAVLHLGNYDFMGGVREHSGDESFHRLQERLRAALHDADTSSLVSIMEQEFGTSTYSLWHLFKDAQRDILFRLTESTLNDLESSFRQIYRQHITLIHAMKEMQIPVPRVFEDPAWYILNVDLNRSLKAGQIDEQKIRHLVNEIIRGKFVPDRSTLSFTASKLLASRSRKMAAAPEDTRVMQEIVNLFTILAPLSLDYELWECQNDYFHTGKKQAVYMLQKAGNGDTQALSWTAAFRALGRWLGVRCI
jgi:alpha-amylase/alpha-mannosidase (GH57 family)